MRWTNSLHRVLRVRWGILAAIDLALWVPALYISALLRLNLEWSRVGEYHVLTAVALAASVHLLAGLAIGVYRGKYRLGSFEEAGGVALATGITVTALALATRIGEIHLIPLGATLAAAGYQLGASLAFRYLVRALRERTLRPATEPLHRVLIYGAGEAGHLAAKALTQESESDSIVVGFLDDDPAKRNLRLVGHRVLGTGDALERTAESTVTDTLLIAMPTAPRERINEIADSAQSLGLKVNLVPRLHRLVNGDVRVADIHEITLADFLSRDEIHLDRDSLDQFLRGKRVLVTGAGGSIGSQICETVLGFEPAALCKLDNSERALYTLEMRLNGRFAVDEHAVLASIRDENRIMEAFEKFQPEVVFHAAAHKHVPFLEAHPVEGYLTNVVGTYNVLRAAEKTGVETFVNVSTDKAAAPANVLGYTKRLAERLTATTARRTPGTFMSVRFGNVLGSEGSVIATFREQLRRNEPLTITHPDVTRYFMTIPEAVELVLQAGAIGGDGEVLVLDMGEPVRIMDLANRVAAELRPGTVPAFEITGLRPGEKLHEVLFSDDDRPLSQPHPLLHRFAVPEIDDGFVSYRLSPCAETLRRMASHHERVLPRELLHRIGAHAHDPVQASAR